MRRTPDATDAAVRDHLILSRMLADAESLCSTRDALLAGQYRHLRGRIAALVELTMPLDREEGEG
ncbi:MAG: hypothetical protein WB677_22300 [Xanthobacteraceae bacterium]